VVFFFATQDYVSRDSVATKRSRQAEGEGSLLIGTST